MRKGDEVWLIAPATRRGTPRYDADRVPLYSRGEVVNVSLSPQSEETAFVVFDVLGSGIWIDRVCLDLAPPDLESATDVEEWLSA